MKSRLLQAFVILGILLVISLITIIMFIIWTHRDQLTILLRLLSTDIVLLILWFIVFKIVEADE